MNTPDEIIEVVTAFKEGKKIQFRGENNSKDPWEDAPAPGWAFNYFEYRVKPEEKKKVKMWQFAFKTPKGINSTNLFYKNALDACSSVESGWSHRIELIGPIPGSEIEVAE